MEEIAERLKLLDTPALSDALDRLGIDGQCLGVMPVFRGSPMVGKAFTVRMLPVGVTGGAVGDYIDEVAAGQVVVIDNGGRRDATVWGDILTTIGARNEVAGTVIYGVCRDVSRSVELGYPIYALGNTMRTGKDRVTAVGYNEPVEVAGVRVDPADWLIGDDDGVVVIPASMIDEVLQTAEEIVAAEERIREAVHSGGRLDEARQLQGYHALQTKRG